jgi:hypothetical protein
MTNTTHDDFMIRDTADVIRALRRHKYLVLSRNPCDGDTWTISSDPNNPGALGDSEVPEWLVDRIIFFRMVVPDGPGRYVLKERPSEIPRSEARAHARAEARRRREEADRERPVH